MSERAAAQLPKAPTRQKGRQMYDASITTLVSQKEKLETMIARIDARIDDLTTRRDKYFR